MSARWKTNGWRAGDQVSKRFIPPLPVVIGSVVRRGRALKVQFVNAAGRTIEEWPEGWAFGAGRHEKTCRQCDNAFRTDDVSEIFCGACDRDELAAMRRNPSNSNRFASPRWKTEDRGRRFR